MKTIQLYIDDASLFEADAKLISTGKDERGEYFLLDATIFYPQGGGQPADQGYIEIDNVKYDVTHVKNYDGEIRHYVNSDLSALINNSCKMVVEGERRMVNSKLHTSGHLISNILESLYKNYKAVRGHHFPGECYVEFAIRNPIPREIDIEKLNQEINKIVDSNLIIEQQYISSNELDDYCPNLPYSIPKNEKVRLIKIAPFPFQPCGGTHVKSSIELHGLRISKQKLNGRTLKISYEIIL